MSAERVNEPQPVKIREIGETKIEDIGAVLRVDVLDKKDAIYPNKTTELDSSQGRGTIYCLASELISHWQAAGGVVLQGKSFDKLPSDIFIEARIGPAWPLVAEIDRHALKLERVGKTTVYEPLGYGAAHPVSGSGQRIWSTYYTWNWDESEAICRPGELLIVGGALSAYHWKALLNKGPYDAFIGEADPRLSVEERKVLYDVFGLIFPPYGGNRYHLKGEIWGKVKKLPDFLGMQIWRRATESHWNDYFSEHDSYTASLLEQVAKLILTDTDKGEEAHNT